MQVKETGRNEKRKRQRGRKIRMMMTMMKRERRRSFVADQVHGEKGDDGQANNFRILGERESRVRRESESVPDQKAGEALYSLVCE